MLGRAIEKNVRAERWFFGALCLCMMVSLSLPARAEALTEADAEVISGDRMSGEQIDTDAITAEGDDLFGEEDDPQIDLIWEDEEEQTIFYEQADEDFWAEDSEILDMEEQVSEAEVGVWDDLPQSDEEVLFEAEELAYVYETITGGLWGYYFEWTISRDGLLKINVKHQALWEMDSAHDETGREASDNDHVEVESLDYRSSEEAPWAAYNTVIQDISIVNERGIEDPAVHLYIGAHTFSDLPHLWSVTIASNVGEVRIGDAAFENDASLHSFSCDNVVSIGENAFAGCTSLSNDIAFPDAIKSIGEGAFAECKELSTVFFAGEPPENYGSIFKGCSVTVYLFSRYAEWAREYERVYGDEAEITWQFLDEKCGDNLIWRYDWDAEAIIISGTGPMYDYDVEADMSPGRNIPPWYAIVQVGSAPYYEIVIEEGVTHIGNAAFCSTYIGRAGHVGPTQLNQYDMGLFAEFPSSLRSIGDYAFYNACYINRFPYIFNFPAQIEKIGKLAFAGDTSKIVEFGGDPPVVADGAFGYTGKEKYPFVLFSAPEDNQLWTEGVRQAYLTNVMSRDNVRMVADWIEPWDGNRYYDGFAGGITSEKRLYVYGGERDSDLKSLCPAEIQEQAEVLVLLRGSYSSGLLGHCLNVREVYNASEENLRYLLGDGDNLFLNATKIQKVANFFDPEGNDEAEFPRYVEKGGVVTEWEKYGSGRVTSTGWYYVLNPIGEIFRVPEDIPYGSLNLNVLQNRLDLQRVVLPNSELSLYERVTFPAAAYSFTVEGYAGSQAETFCQQQGIPFVAIGQAEAMDEFLTRMTYSFPNTASSFEYPANYLMPYAPFSRIWGPCVYSDELYRKQAKWNGSCFGMSATSALLNAGSSGIAPRDFKETGELVSDLSVKDRAALRDLDVRSFIEMFQVSQFTTAHQDALAQNRVYGSSYEDLLAFYKSIEAQVGSGTASSPVILALYGSTGAHAVLAYGTRRGETDEADASWEAAILVYDSNYPMTPKKVTFTIDESQKRITWSYPIDATHVWSAQDAGASLSYVPYSLVERIWKLDEPERNGNQSILRTSNKNVLVKDAFGKTVAAIVNGVFISYDQQIFKGSFFAGEGDAAGTGEDDDGQMYIWMAADAEYVLENTKPADGEGLDLTLVNTDIGVSVTTDSETVTVAACDDQSKGIARIDTGLGDDYQIRINSTQDTHTETILVGKGSGGTVEMASVDGELKLAGDLEGAKLYQNGAVKKLPGSAPAPVAKQKAFLKLNVKTIKLAKGQTTTGLKAAMAAGDSIKSVKSSKKKVVAASVKNAAKGIIKLKGKKVGKAVVTVTLASGKSAKVKVTVQKKKVAVSKISVAVPKRVSMKKKQKLAIGAVVAPFTAADKPSYKSSNKKVVTVSKKGVMVARAAGTARVTVQAGKKKTTLQVRVKG